MRILKRIRAGWWRRSWRAARTPVTFMLLPAVIAGFVFVMLYVVVSPDNPAMAFVAGAMFGSTATMIGIHIGLIGLHAIEEQRHQDMMRHLDDELNKIEKLRKAEAASTVWVVADGEN